MNADIASESANVRAPTREQDAYLRLSPLGWNRGLALIVALLAASFFLAGYFNVYWRSADMDLIVVHNALLLNEGQTLFFDHPAYFTVLSVKLWFQLLHFLNLLDAWTMSAIPSASDVPAFDAAMTSGVTKLQGRPTLTRALHKSGRKLYVEMTFAIVKGDAEGHVLGSVAMARDVTDRVERERAARRAP